MPDQTVAYPDTTTVEDVADVSEAIAENVAEDDSVDVAEDDAASFDFFSDSSCSSDCDTSSDDAVASFVVLDDDSDAVPSCCDPDDFPFQICCDVTDFDAVSASSLCFWHLQLPFPSPPFPLHLSHFPPDLSLL